MYKIGIIEDEYIIAQDIVQSVRSFGYDVAFVSSSADDAVQNFELNRPDIIIVDISLAGKKNGIDVVAEIKKLHNPKVVFLTAHHDDETLEKCKSVKPNGFITKPFTDSTLKAAIYFALLDENNRSISDGSEIIDLGNGYHYNMIDRLLVKNGEVSLFSKMTMSLLHLFLTNLNKQISFIHIENTVYEGEPISMGTIRNITSILRNEFPNLTVKSISGVGYIATLKRP